MGKKRTNAAKKKQVTRKKKLSSAYGVSVLKGGTIARNNGILDGNHMADANARAKRQQAVVSNGGHPLNATSTHNDDGNSTHMPTRAIQGKRPRNAENEKDEFNRLHASLEERSLALQAQKDYRRRSKKERQKLYKQGWGKFARPSTINLPPATLKFAPKSTNELVDDAANQVAQGMTDIGQRVTNITSGAPVSGQSSLAAIASLNWKMNVASVSNLTQQSQNQNNPFAVLDDESDIVAEGIGKQTCITVQTFQFRPATFSFQPSSSSQSALRSGSDDVDPDL